MRIDLMRFFSSISAERELLAFSRDNYFFNAQDEQLQFRPKWEGRAGARSKALTSGLKSVKKGFRGILGENLIQV